jgi:RNA polymerase sigma-70 factor (ECF subfamily)
MLEGLDELLPLNHRVPAVRAELLLRQGDVSGARAAYERAIWLCGNQAERRYLTARLAALS